MPRLARTAAGRRRAPRFASCAVNRHFAECMERLPSDALRVRDPVLVRLGVATILLVLFQQRSLGRNEVLPDAFQLCVRFDLKAEVIEPSLRAAARYGEI